MSTAVCAVRTATMSGFFWTRWRQQKGEEVEEHLDYEVKGIHDILKNCSEFSIHMGGVYIDGQMEAFTIGSYNPVEHMAVTILRRQTRRSTVCTSLSTNSS